jgi:hypothetical protein
MATEHPAMYNKMDQILPRWQEKLPLAPTSGSKMDISTFFVENHLIYEMGSFINNRMLGSIISR